MADIFPRFALSITHAPWLGERVASMQRLRTALEGEKLEGYHEETERAPWWVWADNQWRWGAGGSAGEATHVVFLQDDAVVAPGFWAALRAMVAAKPCELISLHCPHPGAMKLAREGVRWCSTADGLVGLGYVFSRDSLRAFIGWREESLRPGGASAPELSEDSLINVWRVTVGFKVFHPIPSIIDHDVGIRSTNNYDAHAYRRPRVLWTDEVSWKAADLASREFWAGDAVHLGRVYAKTHWAAKLVVPRFDRFFEVESDTCPPEYARFFTCQ